MFNIFEFPAPWITSLMVLSVTLPFVVLHFAFEWKDKKVTLQSKHMLFLGTLLLASLVMMGVILTLYSHVIHRNTPHAEFLISLIYSVFFLYVFLAFWTIVFLSDAMYSFRHTLTLKNRVFITSFLFVTLDLLISEFLVFLGFIPLKGFHREHILFIGIAAILAATITSYLFKSFVSKEDILVEKENSHD